MSCKTCTRDNQNINTPNLMFAQENYQDNISIHADYPMFKQEYFKQEATMMVRYRKNTRASWITQTLPLSRINELISRGYDVQQVNKPIVTPKPVNIIPNNNLDRDDVLNIVRGEYGDDISLLHSNSVNLGNALNSAKKHRNSIESKVDNAVLDYSDFHKKFTDLGNALNSAKKHRDSIESKINNSVLEHSDFHKKFTDLGNALNSAKKHRNELDSKIDNHSHGNSGNNNKSECEWWDIACTTKKGAEDSVKQIAILGALGVGGYLLLKKL